MSAQPCISMKLMLTEVEFGVLREVGEENTLSPEEVLKTILEEYVEQIGRASCRERVSLVV